LTKSERLKTEKEAQKSKDELELLMFDPSTSSTATTRHFEMKDVIKAEKLKGKKNLKKKGKKTLEGLEAPQPDFELNVSDPRFAQVLTSHQYAIDPTNPK
jgi:hypothetical protein